MTRIALWALLLEVFNTTGTTDTTGGMLEVYMNTRFVVDPLTNGK